LCFNKNINFENGNIYINSLIIMHDIQKGTLWAIAYSKYQKSNAYYNIILLLHS
jgi:hypothetical protein